MMLERLSPVRLLYVRVGAVARYAEDLVVILRLAALERRLGTLELPAQRAHVRVRVFKLGLLECGSEVRDGILVLFIVQPDACARAQRFERARLEEQACLGVDERVVMAGKLGVRSDRCTGRGVGRG